MKSQWIVTSSAVIPSGPANCLAVPETFCVERWAVSLSPFHSQVRAVRLQAHVRDDVDAVVAVDDRGRFFQQPLDLFVGELGFVSPRPGLRSQAACCRRHHWRDRPFRPRPGLRP